MSKRMVLDEDRLMQQLDKDAQYYLRKYGPQMEALQYSPLARKGIYPLLTYAPLAGSSSNGTITRITCYRNRACTVRMQI